MSVNILSLAAFASKRERVYAPELGRYGIVLFRNKTYYLHLEERAQQQMQCGVAEPQSSLTQGFPFGSSTSGQSIVASVNGVLVTKLMGVS